MTAAKRLQLLCNQIAFLSHGGEGRAVTRIVCLLESHAEICLMDQQIGQSADHIKRGGKDTAAGIGKLLFDVGIICLGIQAFHMAVDQANQRVVIEGK